MLSEAVRFASWAAGEGICPADGQPARAPEDFLMDYSDATGETEWETMADRLPSILSTGQEVTTSADGALEASSTLGTGGHIPSNPWTQWNGGENPAPGKVVGVRFRFGEIAEYNTSESYEWSHPWSTPGNPKLDIIAYRIIPTDAGKDPS